jgi:hypothetical protein
MKLNKIGLLGLLTIGIGLGMGFVGDTGSKTLVSSTAWVDDDDPTCGGNSPCFRTIQAAVDAVDDSDVRGGFVYILPGRYRENVVIKRVVSLIGVGNVYLEALDPKRPTILVSNGLESRPIEMITGLEIFGGKTGIELVDARVKMIARNRIRGYPSFGSPLLTNAGIWIERAVMAEGYGIFGNEISDAASGIFLKQGAVVELISNNIIQHTGWGIGLQDDAKVFSIRTNTFQNNQTHIRMTGNGLAYILSNQMLLAEQGGIIVEAERASLTIENNFIANSNMVGIYLACQPDFTEILFRVDSKCPGQQGPRFEIVRNQITGGRYGIIVVTGQGKIVRNWILGNGFISEYISLLGGAGLLLGLGQKMEVEISHNWIVNNRVGAAYSLFAAANAWDCQLEEIPPFEGKLTGRDNKIEDNELRDFCPPDYPWPAGFRK